MTWRTWKPQEASCQALAATPPSTRGQLRVTSQLPAISQNWISCSLSIAQWHHALALSNGFIPIHSMNSFCLLAYKFQEDMKCKSRVSNVLLVPCMLRGTEKVCRTQSLDRHISHMSCQRKRKVASEVHSPSLCVAFCKTVSDTLYMLWFSPPAVLSQSIIVSAHFRNLGWQTQ